VRYVALVAAGGMANLCGVLAISTVLVFLSLRGVFGSLDDAAFGAILILIISLAPRGPLEPLGAWLRRLFVRKRVREAETSGPREAGEGDVSPAGQVNP